MYVYYSHFTEIPKIQRISINKHKPIVTKVKLQEHNYC